MADISSVLITGGESRIGMEIGFGNKLGHKDLDITNLDSVKNALEKHKPSAVLNLASLNLMQCQTNPLLANKVNIMGVYNLAIETAKRGIPLILISSGTVFNGSDYKDFSEKDIPDPVNFYGQTKYLAEIMAQLNPKHIVIRTGWLFGFNKKANFFNKMLESARKNEELKATADQYGSFTYVKEFIENLKDIIIKEEYGIFHIVNRQRATALDFAHEIVKLISSKSKIIKISIANSEKEGPLRSRSEVLVSSKVKLRDWKVALKECLAN